MTDQPLRRSEREVRDPAAIHRIIQATNVCRVGFVDAGEPYGEIAAQAKLFASETASFVASKAVQVHGGAGVVEDLHPVERYFRDARVTEIIEGTSEIQKLVVAGWELRG